VDLKAIYAFKAVLHPSVLQTLHSCTGRQNMIISILSHLLLYVWLPNSSYGQKSWRIHELWCTSASFLKHPELFPIRCEEIQRHYYSFQEIFLSLEHKMKTKEKQEAASLL